MSYSRKIQLTTTIMYSFDYQLYRFPPPFSFRVLNISLSAMMTRPPKSESGSLTDLKRLPVYHRWRNCGGSWSRWIKYQNPWSLRICAYISPSADFIEQGWCADLIITYNCGRLRITVREPLVGQMTYGQTNHCGWQGVIKFMSHPSFALMLKSGEGPIKFDRLSTTLA